jgi:hypothetical protein
MTKKFLVSLAAVAALSTSAMAYDDLAAVNAHLEGSSDQHALNYDATKFQYVQGPAQGLIFPLVAAVQGYSTTFRVTNDNSKPVVAKVVIKNASDSREIFDFNLYLSAHDSFIGKIQKESDGVYLIVDDSSVEVQNFKYQTPTGEYKIKLTKPDGSDFTTGYIEVIGMVTYNNGDLHGSNLISAYYKDVYGLRGVADADPSQVLYDKGVPYLNNGKKFTVPFVDVSKNANWSQMSQSLLGEEILENDSLNLKSIIDAVGVDYTDDDAHTLVYLPKGETGTFADATLDYNVAGDNQIEYNVSKLETMLSDTSPKKVYLPYEDDVNPAEYNYYVTTPFKLNIVKTAEYSAGKQTIKIFEAKDSNTSDYDLGNWGYTLAPFIYDNDEHYTNDFSPATSNFIWLSDEVAFGTDDSVLNPKTMLNKALSIGYKNGYILLERQRSANDVIPGIVTIMQASKLPSGINVVNFKYAPQSKQ